MDEKTRFMVLFRELAAEKFLENELNISFPRSSLLDLIIAFKEKYAFDILSICDYCDLAEIFAECVSIYTAQSMFRFDRKNNRFYIAVPLKKIKISDCFYSSWADYHENRAP